MTDYEFYNTNYLSGTEAVIPETAFSFWERKAAQIIKKHTFGNIDETITIPLEVQFCTCDVATLLYNAEQNDQKGVMSEKDGQWSASYESSEQAKTNLKSQIAETIYLWLADTGYLYSGV